MSLPACLTSLAHLLLTFILFGISLAPPGSFAQPVPEATREIVLNNVRVFNGRDPQLGNATNVIVRGNRIAAIGGQPATDAVMIDGKGHTLMPGLIDAHAHLMFVNATYQELLIGDTGYLYVLAVQGAERMLLRGFTSVRDMGGPIFGLKRGIDRGVVPGPRIWPSGSVVSQSGGHGDFRFPNQLPARPGDYSHTESIGAATIADGESLVLRRVREQLALGASQIKVTAGGGISSPFDPIDVAQYTVREMRAAVEAAENWGTYVTVHAYTPRAVRMAIEAGVKCIEHGQLLDEDTARLMAARGIWWSLQPFIEEPGKIDRFPVGSHNWLKERQVWAGTDRAYRFARQHKIRVAWGTDLLLNPAAQETQNQFLTRTLRWYSPAEALRMATFDNGELLALSGQRNSYDAPVGIIREGALADLLLIAGNPLENLELVADPQKNIVIIMKDGKIHKNILAQAR